MLDCVRNAPVPVQVEDGHCFPEVRPQWDCAQWELQPEQAPIDYFHEPNAPCKFCSLHACYYHSNPKDDSYFDVDGNPIELQTLVRREPEWAASTIAALKKRLRRNLSRLAHEVDSNPKQEP